MAGHTAAGMKPEERRALDGAASARGEVHADGAWRFRHAAAPRSPAGRTTGIRASRAASPRSRRWKSPVRRADMRCCAPMRTRRARAYSALSRIAPRARRPGARISPARKTSTTISRAAQRARRAAERGAGSTPCGASRFGSTASMAGTTRIRASTCATSPTSRCASAGSWKSIRMIRSPCRASAPRSDDSSTKAPTHGRQERPRRRLHG